MGLVVETRYGRVQGGRTKGAQHWLGVKYAEAKRFGLPQPPAHWSGTKPATAYGPECPQFFGVMAPEKKIAGPEVSEDCLVLNIWTPDIPPESSDMLKPVMVWIHGGAFMTGSGNVYDGTHLAANGDIVVVSINYRLGVLGFANLGDALECPDIPSNLGIRDQIAALEWIRDNIAAFGGDPQRVTIAGESAGSLTISMLMICQKAWPLFHGAIMESGATSLIHSRQTSQVIGNHYRKALRLEIGDIDKLRSLDISTLLKSHIKVQAMGHGSVPAAPWFDDDLLPASLAEARSASTAKVPIIAGFNREEIRTFEIIKGPAILPLTRSDNEALIRQQLSEDAAEKLLAVYADNKEGTRSLATHLTFAMPTVHFAERQSAHSPTWFYRFDYKHPLVGAAHGVEVAFIWPLKGLFGLFVRGGFLLGKRRGLAKRMQQHWAHFVKHGNPGDDWPGYSATHRSVKLFNLKDQIADDPDRIQRQAWNGIDLSTIVDE